MKPFTRWPVAARLAAAGLGLMSAALLASRFPAAPAHAAPPVAPAAANLVTADGSFGTIKGRLIWGGSSVPEPKKLVVNKDEQVCGKDGPLVDHKLTVDAKTKGVKWGLAYIVNPKGENPEALEALIKERVDALIKKHPTVVLDQKSCEYLPYVLAMNENQSLLLKSSDEVNHNVHLNAFTNEPFNVILPPKGELPKKLVAERRPMPMTCDIHPWMQAWVAVFKHPFFAVTDTDGSFEIQGVPAGAQKLVLWQPAVGYVTAGAASGMGVLVEAGKTTDVGELKLDPSKVK